MYKRQVYVTDTLDRCGAAIAAPIISEGDALGLVLFVENEGENHVGETEYKLCLLYTSKISISRRKSDAEIFPLRYLPLTLTAALIHS